MAIQNLKSKIQNPGSSRLQVVIRLERLALAGRYLAYFVLITLLIATPNAASLNDLIAVTALVAIQNGFVHAVLWSRRYHLFRSPLNFLIHLTATTFIIYFTGAEDSELYILYFFLLIGYTAYSRRYSMILIVSFVFCLSYTAMLGIEWALHGLSPHPEAILLQILSIPLCGWLVANISELLREAEDDARSQAQALASSEATIRTILDNTADPILAYDEQEFITEANNRTAQMLGLPRDQVLGRRFRDFLFDDGTLPDMMREVHAKDEYHGEQLFVDADGQEHEVELHVHSFTVGPAQSSQFKVQSSKLTQNSQLAVTRFFQNRVRGERGPGFGKTGPLETQNSASGGRVFVAVAHDIAGQKKLEEAARLANVNLNRLNRQLQQVNELKTGLLRSISLRIRSPLTAVLGYFDMLLRDELGELAPDQRTTLQTSRRSVLRVFDVLDETQDVPIIDADDREPGAKHRTS